MCPAEAQRLFGGSPGDQPVAEAGGEAVTAADAIEHVEPTRGADEALAAVPQDGRPVMTVARVDLPQGRPHQLDTGILLDHAIDHAEECVVVELCADAPLFVSPQRRGEIKRWRGDFRTG